MTTPTQAQIEAILDDYLRRITAAAEAVEPPFELQYSAKGIVRERNATIERCAQIADDEADKQYDEGKANILRKAAAAIRALKEKS